MFRAAGLLLVLSVLSTGLAANDDLWSRCFPGSSGTAAALRSANSARVRTPEDQSFGMFLYASESKYLTTAATLLTLDHGSVLQLNVAGVTDPAVARDAINTQLRDRAAQGSPFTVLVHGVEALSGTSLEVLDVFMKPLDDPRPAIEGGSRPISFTNAIVFLFNTGSVASKAKPGSALLEDHWGVSTGRFNPQAFLGRIRKHSALPKLNETQTIAWQKTKLGLPGCRRDPRETVAGLFGGFNSALTCFLGAPALAPLATDTAGDVFVAGVFIPLLGWLILAVGIFLWLLSALTSTTRTTTVLLGSISTGRSAENIDADALEHPANVSPSAFLNFVTDPLASPRPRFTPQKKTKRSPRRSRSRSRTPKRKAASPVRTPEPEHVSESEADEEVDTVTPPPPPMSNRRAHTRSAYRQTHEPLVELADEDTSRGRSRSRSRRH